MAPAMVLLLGALLVFAGICSGDSEGAFLLVHKTADLKRSKAGSELVTVSLTVHNAGSTTAYDVSLIDDAWPSALFNVVSGNTSASWDKLEVGKSLQHKLVLEPKIRQLFHCSPAVVKYRVAAKSALQEALSTPLPPLDLLSDKPAGLQYDFIKNLAVKYGPLVAVLSLIGLFALIMLSPSSAKKSKSSKKRR